MSWLHDVADRFDADQQDLKPEPTIESLGFRPKTPAAAGAGDGEADKIAEEQEAEEGEEGPSSSGGGGSGEDEEEEEKELQEDMERLFAAREDMEASGSGSEGGLANIHYLPAAMLFTWDKPVSAVLSVSCSFGLMEVASFLWEVEYSVCGGLANKSLGGLCGLCFQNSLMGRASNTSAIAYHGMLHMR